MSGFELAQAQCEKGGWATGRKPTAKQIKAAERRWIDRSYETKPGDEDDYDPQCGGAESVMAVAKATGVPVEFFYGEESDEEERQPMSLDEALLELARSQALMSQMLVEMRRERRAS